MGGKQLSVRLPSELASRVKVKAWSQGLSVTAVVTRLLEDWAADVDLHPDSLVPARPATVVPPAEKKKKPELVTTSLDGPQDLPDSQLAKMLEPPLEEEERQRALGELLKDPRIQVGSSFKGPDPKPAGKKR